MPRSERRLIAEAAVALGVARLLLLLVPFRLIAARLSRGPRNPKAEPDPSLNAQVRRAVTIAARNVPWNAVCLPQAIAAKFMLQRRGYASTLHLGVGRDQAGKLIGHAWLDANGGTVVGAAGKEAVTPLSHFG